MPICPTCDGDSFHDENGKFYCDVCGSESLEIQVVVKQELEFDSYTASQHLKLSKKKERKVKVPDVGKPWVIYEGIQCLLKAQVEALIKMGFNEKLKDVVGQFWFSFLCSKKVAFCEEEASVLSMRSETQTGRHRNTGLLPPSIKRQRLLVVDEMNEDEFSNSEDQKNTIEGNSQNMKSEDDDGQDPEFSQRLDEELEKLRHLDVDVKEEIESERVETEADSEEDEKMSHTGSLRSVQLKNDNKQDKIFSQERTLCFCYMALVWLEEPVLISDLVRWAREGTLPYHKAAQVLPTEMKFSFYDAKIFNTKHSLDVQKAFVMCASMARLLEVDVKFTKEMCKIVTTAAIFDLQLSKSVCILANHLLDLTDFSVSFNKKVNKHSRHATSRKKTIQQAVDGYIAAFIAISVKLIYCLNDYHEFNDCTRDSLLQKLHLPPLEESWYEWVTKHLKKRKKKLYNGVPSSQKDLEYIEDLSVYADYCTKDVFKSFQHRETTRPYNRGPGKSEQAFDGKAKENYHDTFIALAEEMNDRTDLREICRVSTSFPFSVSHLGENVSSLKKDCVEASDDTHSRCNNVNKDNIEASVDMSSAQDNANAEEALGKLSSNQDSIHVNKGNVHNEASGQMSSSQENSNNQPYVIYTEDGDSSWHSSYTYFMGVLSQRFGVPTLRVQTCVHNLEIILFKQDMLEKLCRY